MAAKKRTVRFFMPFRMQPDGTAVELNLNFWPIFRNKLAPLTASEQFVTLRGVEYRGDARHEPAASTDYFYLGKRDLTPCVGHAQSQECAGGSEMIQRDGKEELSR